MATSTTDDPAPAPVEIDLEPTRAGELSALGGAAAGAAAAGAPAGAGQGQGGAGAQAVRAPGAGSLSGEIDGLRRRRLASAAWFLAVVFAASAAWKLVDPGLEGNLSGAWILDALRLALVVAVAIVLVGRGPLGRWETRSLEYLLFGGVTLLFALKQHQVGVELLRREDVLGTITFIKNGAFSMVLLMIVYGMFVPNDPKTTAVVVASMALALVFTLVLTIEHEAAEGLVEELRTAERIGSNAFFLMVGAALAVYGSHVLHGLRHDLREARRFGQYQLMQKLGEGGMGEVYLAEHQLLKRPCALKLIGKQAGGDPIALARFEREVQAAARLSHPNTIEIYDYGHADDGTFYYVMEHLKGMNLSELVHRMGPLPPGRLVYLFRQVCAGLAEAHALGLVHRDLKPANVFVAVRGGEADVAKILDFGLVKLTKGPHGVELSSDLTVSGTPSYMAPEQAMGDRSLDARADIYALGAVLYFALTGHAPFQADSPFEIMMAHARDPVVPPSELRPEVPADLERVVLRCLSKRPGDRFPTVRALNEALGRCESAADWGPHRAEAWWVAQGVLVLEDGEGEGGEGESERGFGRMEQAP